MKNPTPLSTGRALSFARLINTLEIVSQIGDEKSDAEILESIVSQPNRLLVDRDGRPKRQNARSSTSHATSGAWVDFL